MSENQQIPIRIAFDEAHKERGRIDSSLSELRDFLTQKGYECMKYAEFPITFENLQPYQILVFACPDNSKFSRQEIEDIAHWVKDGNGLLMLSHAGGDKGRRSNLSELAEQFGIIFENDQVLDQANNLGVVNLPTFSEFPMIHPITQDIQGICYRAGCSLSMSSMGITPVISSGPYSTPIESPLMLAGEFEEGRVVGLGSYEMFRDRISGGLDYSSHKQIVENIFDWLTTSKHLEAFQDSLKIVESPPKETEISPTVHTPTPPQQPRQEAVPQMMVQQKEYESKIKILSTKDLFKAFEDLLTDFISFKDRMQSEFDTLQSNIMKLLQNIIATEEDMVNIGTLEDKINHLKAQIPKASTGNTVKGSSGTAPHFPPPQSAGSSANGPDQQRKSSSKKSSMGIDPNTLAALRSLDQIKQPSPKTPDQPTPAEPVVSKKQKTSLQKNSWDTAGPTSPMLEKTPEEIVAELDSLENKLKGIKDLTSFLEKKMETGGISKEKYDRQIGKLEKDRIKTNKKIQTLQAQLK